MQKKNMRKEIQERVRGYMEHLLEEENNRKHDQEQFLALMPEHLRKDILMDLNGKLLTDNKIFSSNFGLKFLKDLATKLKERSLGPGEKLYTENDKSQENCFFIVTKGKVQLFFQKTNQSLKNLTAGEYFGEVAFFSNKTRTISARSLNYSQVFYLEKSSFTETLENYDREKESYCEIRDKINFYDDYAPLQLKCFACNKENHFAKDCPQLHYVPDPQDIIALVRKEDETFMKGFKRKSRKRYHVLINKPLIHQATEKFRDDILIAPFQKHASRNSSLSYKPELRRKKSQGESSLELDHHSIDEEDREDKQDHEFKPELLSLIEEDLMEECSQVLVMSPRSRTFKFRDLSHYIDGNKAEVTKSYMRKQKVEVIFDKVKIFNRYFIHNNIDIIARSINRANKLKREPPKQEKKGRRRSTTDSLELGSLLKKPVKPPKLLNSLSILPSFFKKQKILSVDVLE